MIVPTREVNAVGFGLGIVGAVYLAFGILRTPAAIGSEVLGPYDADRMYPKGPTHVSMLATSELARASLSGRYGLGCLVISGLLQLVASLLPAGETRVVTPLLLAIGAMAIAAMVGRRYVKYRSATFLTAIWGSPATTSVVELKTLRENSMRATKWCEGPLISAIQRFFLG